MMEQLFHLQSLLSKIKMKIPLINLQSNMMELKPINHMKESFI